MDAPRTDESMPHATIGRSLTRRPSAFVSRLLALLAAWWVVSAGGPWEIGAPVALLGALLDVDTEGPRVRWWRPDSLLRFALFYTGQAISGGVDVALRALDPRRSVDPRFVPYPLRLPPGAPRSLMATTISMLPGTVAADVRNGELIVQSIHPDVPVEDACRRTEEVVAAVFGLSLQPPAARSGSDGPHPGRQGPGASATPKGGGEERRG